MCLFEQNNVPHDQLGQRIANLSDIGLEKKSEMIVTIFPSKKPQKSVVGKVCLRPSN